MSDNWSAEAATVEYQSNVSFELNERPGKLYPLAGSSKNYAGSTSAKIDNIFDDIYLEDKITRNGDTNNIDPSMRTRWIHKPGSANVAPLIDRDAQKETSVELGAPVVTQTTNGVRRYHDDKFLAGFWGNAYAGENGLVTVPFAAGNRIAGNFEGSLTGLTKPKLVEMRRLLGLADVDIENERPIILVDADAQADLLAIEEYVNVDYTNQKVLDTGELKPWLGFRFVPTNMGSAKAYPRTHGLFNVGGVNRLPVFVPSGLHRGVWIEFWGKVSDRGDKQHSWQFFAEAESAVVRVKEEKCWFIETKPAG
jgi:hypothetical protein